ncbi:MAG: hypothetical protein V3V61_06820 [Gammaproteobacteria bacterium]
MASSPAYAYIDPGSGSIILASVVAGFAMLRVAGKLYWRKLCTFFSRDKSASEPQAESGKLTKDDDRTES